MRQDTGTQLKEPSTCGEPDEPSLVVRSRPDFDPGVVAVSTGAGPFLGVHSSCGRFDAWQQGFLDPLESDRVVSLSLLRRRHDVDVDDDDVRGQDSPTGGGLDGVAPPFAATHMARDGSVLRAITDSLGFRHLYAHQAEDSAYISTSAHRLSPLTGNRIDPVGIAQLCNLGWQIGTRTSFDGITKLPPQSTVSLQGGRAVVVREPRPQSELTSDVDCARAAASILRSSMERLLDDHPDAILQLTGGLDSRLLLAAIPAERRRDVDVLTLAVPGSQDLTIAKDLAARFGMGHHVISMSGLEALEPVEAFGRSCAAARHLDCAADPLGYAALGFAEGGTDDRLRIAGLGGEVARGFYYFGPQRTVPVSRERVERLARWRMFPNESVPLDVLQPSFGAWARESTIDSIHEAFLDFDTDWFRATDEFYLLQRMQRWAGVLATADCMRRTVVNPMLDHRFLDIVRSAPPTAKRNARLLSRILVELDPDLANVPMDGRPAPVAYSRGGFRSVATSVGVTTRKIAGKVRQRVEGRQRPPVGAPVLAALVLDHWRSEPSTLDPIRPLAIVDERWLDEVVLGDGDPPVTAVSLLTSLLAATGA